MRLLSEAIHAQWTAAGDLPGLRFQYIPIEEFEDIATTRLLAAFKFDGFNRELGNGGIQFDTYNVAFTVIGLEAGPTWEAGQRAIAAMSELEAEGLYNAQVTPSEMATPAELGGMNVWSFGFTGKYSLLEEEQGAHRGKKGQSGHLQKWRGDDGQNG
jgi:hypothetical protein